MIWLGAIMFALGGWVCIQSTSTRFAPAVAIGGLVIMVLCWPGYAHGRDLDGRYAQSPLKSWFDNLKSKGGSPCCSDADGTAISDVDWETRDGHYRVRVDGQWIDVPESAVIDGPNRAGPAMVWPIKYLGNVQIRCFLPGSMT